jgi:Zn-dependent M28 family amino/carboxypeptidase
VAGLLELSRAFAGLEPALTVRFVAFANEEPPFFLTGQQGSAVHAAAARARGERIALMVSLEMLGFYDDRPGSQRYPPLFRRFYPDRGDFLGFVGDLRSRRAMRRAAAAFRAASDLPLETCATFRWVPASAGATTRRSGATATGRSWPRTRPSTATRGTTPPATRPGRSTTAGSRRRWRALAACFAALAAEGRDGLGATPVE